MGLGLSGARLSAGAAGDILPESGSYRSLAAFSYRHGRTQQRRPRHPAFQLHPQTRDQRWRRYPAATLERFGDRKSVVTGKSVSVLVDTGGGGRITKKNKKN